MKFSTSIWFQCQGCADGTRWWLDPRPACSILSASSSFPKRIALSTFTDSILVLQLTGSETHFNLWLRLMWAFKSLLFCCISAPSCLYLLLNCQPGLHFVIWALRDLFLASELYLCILNFNTWVPMLISVIAYHFMEEEVEVQKAEVRYLEPYS